MFARSAHRSVPSVPRPSAHAAPRLSTNPSTLSAPRVSCGIPLQLKRWGHDRKNPIPIILTKDNNLLGPKGMVVRVRPGYARNYLFPNQLAVLPTETNLKHYEKWTVKADQKGKEKHQEQLRMIQGLQENPVIHLKRGVRPDGTYKFPITAKRLADYFHKNYNERVPLQDVQFTMMDRPGSQRAKVKVWGLDFELEVRASVR